MGKPEHLEILKNGMAVWNQWREENPKIRPDLCYCDLRYFDFERMNLSSSKLNWAKLMNANLSATNLLNTDFTGSILYFANFTGSLLKQTDFTKSFMAGTVLINIDLSDVKGLDSVKHVGPSSISIDTIYQSKGKIPKTFLRGAGLPEDFLKGFDSSSVKSSEYYSTFISYSSKDQEFADLLYLYLQNKGVRCWFAPEDLKIGDKIRQRIDQSIRIHDKLLLILSENSIGSDWVEDEVESAYEEEKNRGKTVLFPVRIDDAVMVTDEAWAAKLRRSRHVGDLTQWRKHNTYIKAFERLLRDLKAED